jgi:Lon protease-like protein
MLPPTIPIFPLPNVVLFPNVFLPLHIFEPRYRAMVADALEDDRIIGMALLQPGWESDYEGRPPVYPIGCAGLITHTEALQDGRYNIVLRGLEKFRIVGEDASKPYRLAHVETLLEMPEEPASETVRLARKRLESLLMPRLEGDSPIRASLDMRDEELVNALAQYLALEPVEKQALLERNGVAARCQSLIELLEMKMLVPKPRWTGIH